MTIEYHVVLVPLFHWTLITPEDLSDLQQLSQVVSRLFSFQWFAKGQIDALTETNWAPILSQRLHHITHEIHRVHVVTDQINQKARKESEELKIEHAYATDFALELVSSSTDVFSNWSDITYKKLFQKLFDFLFGIHKPNQIQVGPISVDRVYADPVATCRIILCDTLEELESLADGLKLKKAKTALYLGGSGERVSENAFNFFSPQWNKLYIPNTLATLKPEKLREQLYQTEDELSFLMFVLHSVGKFYAIHDSIKGVCANLEWSSWYMHRMFEKYEAKLCWSQRILFDITKNVSSIENKIRELIMPLTLVKTAPEAIALIQHQYGGDFFGVNVDGFLSLASDPNLKNYTHSSAKDFSGEELAKSINSCLEELAVSIIGFMEKFKDTANSWKELKRSNRMKNQLLITLLGLVLTFILNIVLRLL